MSDKRKAHSDQSALDQICDLWRQVCETGLRIDSEWYASLDAFLRLECMAEFATRDIHATEPYLHSPHRVSSIYGYPVSVDETLGKGMIEFRCPDATFTAQLK